MFLCESYTKHVTFSVFSVPAADFGFARYLQNNMMAATLCGSPMYMVRTLMDRRRLLLAGDSDDLAGC